LTIVDPSGTLLTSKIVDVTVDEPPGGTMSRVQLALNVGDLEASIDFYTKLFGTPPAKIRENYANFAIAEPPLKLVLIAGQGEPGSLNHLGIEVESTAEVAAATARMQSEGAACEVQDSTTCCFAVQDKVWVSGPELPWEIYTVLADAPVMHPSEGECCGPEAVAEPVALGARSSSTCC
jgi:catechol 2,3-dioxygenase-like lactoylglutathione lyase family enzyme